MKSEGIKSVYINLCFVQSVMPSVVISRSMILTLCQHMLKDWVLFATECGSPPAGLHRGTTTDTPCGEATKTRSFREAVTIFVPQLVQGLFRVCMTVVTDRHRGEADTACSRVSSTSYTTRTLSAINNTAITDSSEVCRIHQHYMVLHHLLTYRWTATLQERHLTISLWQVK